MYTHAEITERNIAAFYRVYNTRGYGFLEKVYHNAMEVELTARGLTILPQAPLKVYYSGVIVELKAADGIATEHHAQLLNYLKATDSDVGLLLNFGPKPEVRRKVYETARQRPISTNTST